MERGSWRGDRLGWRYGGGPWLFRDYSLEVMPGEIVGLMGPSGTGKSTLGRLLAGYMAPVEGEVGIDGAPLPTDGYCPAQLIHQHPEHAVNPRWTIRRTLEEGGRPDSELLDAFGIENAWLSRYPGELSGGQLQRCCIVRSLGPKTRYLVADEMTVMLDAITQAEIWRALLAIAARRGIGVLAISHDEPLLHAIGDRIIRVQSAVHFQG
ncbi:MAG: Nickel-transporting ATPase [Paenibacillus sp.]|nr:Nickel-transporting ATPase [Paenibacillus sp.]